MALRARPPGGRYPRRRSIPAAAALPSAPVSSFIGWYNTCGHQKIADKHSSDMPIVRRNPFEYQVSAALLDEGKAESSLSLRNNWPLISHARENVHIIRLSNMSSRYQPSSSGITENFLRTTAAIPASPKPNINQKQKTYHLSRFFFSPVILCLQSLRSPLGSAKLHTKNQNTRKKEDCPNKVDVAQH